MNIKVRVLFFTTLFLIIHLGGQLFAWQNDIYSVEKTIRGDAQKFGENNTVQFRVLENGKEKYLITLKLDYDSPVPALRVFSNGASVLINSFTAQLTFFDATGEQLLQSNILKEIAVEYERSVYSSISGESLVIALKQPVLDYLVLKLYNSRGQFLNEFNIAERHINGLSYSAELNLIALSVYDWQNDDLNKSTLFFNSTGQQKAVISEDFTSGHFTEQQSLFIGYSNKNCFVYDLNNNLLSFSKLATEEKMILTAVLEENEIIIVETQKPTLLNGQWYYENPLFSRYQKNGGLISQNTILSQPFSKYKLYKKDFNLLFQTENKVIPVK